MAWDVERTKTLLLEAATAEFSAFGLAGARVDRIAAAAGVNKERIYQYFGKKDELFDAVLASELQRVMRDVPIRGSGPGAMGDYAARLFDHHRADPVFARLMFWEGLERGNDIAARAERAAQSARKVDSVLAVLPGITRTDAADLLLTAVTLCDGSRVLPQIDGLLAGLGDERVQQRRAFIVRTVTLLAETLSAEAAQRPGSGTN